MKTLSEDQWTALLARQKELEDNAYSEGAARFRRRLQQAEDKGAASTLGGPRKLLRLGLGKMEEAITALIEDAGYSGPGKRHIARRWCEKVGADVAAYITLKVVLDGIGRKAKLQPTALAVAGLLLDELRYRRFMEKAPHLFEYKLKSFHTSSYAHMARSLNASMAFAGIDCSDLKLSPAQRINLGTKLIGILIETTGLVELERTHDYTRRTPGVTLSLVATKQTRKWIAESNAAMEMWQPIVMPMIVPPLKWEKGVVGGYRFALRGQYGLVRRTSKDVAATVARTNLPVVYEAINTLQNTAWRINQRVLDTVEQIVKLGGGIAGVPGSDDLPLPAKPHDIAENEEARRAWRKLARPVKQENAVRRQQAVSLTKTLAVARAIRSENAVHFPYSLDFRGRLYPIAIYLTPQGDDLSRALLTFADGKPVDAAGVCWLAIHGANCMGETPEGAKVSKLTMEERYEWVIKNSARIISAADAPTENTWWAKADEPLQFLAFCFEWANLIRANDRGEQYVCSLPCSMDGSCNGLQHFSALFCDETGGRAVNVVPQEEPQDLYDAIAQKVLDAMSDEATSDPIAMRWLGLHQKTNIISRKLCKRPTMTFGYGSKQYGFKKQVAEYLRSLENYKAIKQHFTTTDDEGKEKVQVGPACALISRLIWEALSSVVVAAFDGMAWMQRATRGITKQNKAVEWTVPLTQFPVRQEYYKSTRKQLRTMLAGTLVRPHLYTSTKDVNPVKQANAVAPNFVHSLDAAALMVTVVTALNEGIEQFAMVHDSYGTVPSDCALLARICRQSFAKLYMQQDVVAGLQAELAAQWKDPAKCPKPPVKGSLDVSQVIASKYFFA